MKIWVKFVIGIVIGGFLALALPWDDTSVIETLDAISTVALHIGRYILFPLMFFSTAVAIHELKQEKRVRAVLFRGLLYLVSAGVLLSVIGTLSTVVFAPERIPIVIEEELIHTLPSFADVLHDVFPKNAFLVFIGSGDYLLPLFALAFVIGLNFTFDRLAARPALQVFDSLSRIFYNINAFVIEIMGLAFIPLTSFFFIRIATSPELALFKQLVLILTIDSAVVVLIIYPVLLYFLCGKTNPFRWIYGSLANVLAGMASGDGYFALNVIIRNGHENLGIPRKVGAVSFPLFTLFGKAGTAMVNGASFILIVTSYSSLGITAQQTIWVMIFSFLGSLLLGPFPGAGAFIALTFLSARFESGYQEGYLILRPLVPILMSFSVALDVLTASLASMLVARHSGMQKTIEVRDYI